MKQLIFISLLLVSSAKAQKITGFDSILVQMKFSTRAELLDKYYPANIDSLYGGYLSSFSYDFKPVGEQDKMIVTQARHVWTTAKAALFYKDSSFARMSRHGFYFLRDKMWDTEYGGFYTLVNRKGEPRNDNKNAYGNAFGIFALAAYYETSHDPQALELVKKAFQWLEKNSHDPVYKGYYQHLQRNGTPIKRPANEPAGSDLGYKDQNSSIHLLEAFTELYHVWPDPLVKERLREMLLLIRDKMIHPKGYLQLFFTADWKPVSHRDSSHSAIVRLSNLDHVSFGHDVETAYLMMEASETLGNHNDTKTMSVGKKMVDHALKYGWDNEFAGFYDRAYYFKDEPSIKILKPAKNWWAQAEGLNTLLIFSRLYPNDKMQYANAFQKLWQYTQTYLIDHEHGDWYEEGLDRSPERKTGQKAHIWKAAYHNFRSLSNCIKMLQSNVKM